MQGRNIARRGLLAARQWVSLSPLIVAIAVSTAVWIAVLVMPLLTLLGMPLALVGIWAIANYFFEIIGYKARGRDDWPVLSIESVSNASRQKGIVFALEVAGLVAVYFWLVEMQWRSLAQLFAVLAAVVLPASAALLAVTRSIPASVNPVSNLRAVAGIGWRYVLILSASVALLFLADFALSEVSWLAIFVVAYGFLLLAYFIGRAVYTRRRVLGVHAPRAPEVLLQKELSKLLEERRAVVAHAYSFAGRDNIGGALEHIEAHAESENEPFDARIWMFQEMAKWREVEAAIVYGRHLVERLEQAELLADAAKIQVTCDYLKSQNSKD